MTRKKPSRRKNQKASEFRRLLLSNAINPAQSRSRTEVGRTSNKKDARTKQKGKIVALEQYEAFKAINYVFLSMLLSSGGLPRGVGASPRHGAQPW
jgi:hypothetical protein